MTDELKLPRLARDLFGTEIESRADAGAFVVSFPASSELPVERYFGTEVLRHDSKSIRMERLNGGAAPLLFNHNWDDPVGMLTGGRIKDGRLIVDAKFFDTERAREVRSMLEGGLRNVSIGYEIHEMTEDKRGTYEATDWTLLEASIVTIPADPSVGIGRSADNQAAKPVRINRMESTPAQPATITKEPQMAEVNNAPAGGTADIQVTDNGTPEQRVPMLEIEGRRKQAIQNLCNANKLDTRFAREWIAGGASLEQVAEDMIKIMQERGKDQMPAGIGMSKKETNQYSVTRALRAAMTKDWSKAGMELEAHKAVMSTHGVNARSGASFFVPMEVQARSIGAGRRDMTVAGVSGSQYLVSTDNQPGNFIDLLRNDSVVLSMGATRLTGLVGNITIPKMTAGGTAYWLADETTQITESQATIGQLSLSPKNVAALTEISHQLMTQSSPDVETMVMNDLAQVLALAIDVAAIRGAGGSGQPQGIVGTNGVGTFDTDSSDSFGDVLGAQVDVMAANALRPGCAYVADPASAALLMSRSRFANTDTPVWNGSLLEGTMAGFPCRATNQMAANTMLFGLWPSVVVAEWGQLELMVNPYSDFTRGLSAVRAWYAIDTGMRYPAAFSYDATVA
jgi:HK97 family phage major capsid protein/HK97 family phage prohead protease